MIDCLLGLGANLGDRAETLRAATDQLRASPKIEVVATSSCYETQPVGGPSGQPSFMNAAVRIRTDLEPLALLNVLQQIETNFGRVRDIRWDARTLDIDLLLYGDARIRDERLVVPHPRMAVRRFVLQPAAEIASEMLHPTIGWQVGKLWKHLNESAPITLISGSDARAVTELASRVAEKLGASTTVFDGVSLSQPRTISLRTEPNGPDSPPRILVWLNTTIPAFRGPVLMLDPRDIETAITETIAAIQASQP